MLAATSSTSDRDPGILFPCLRFSLMVCVGGEALEPIASVHTSENSILSRLLKVLENPLSFRYAQTPADC